MSIRTVAYMLAAAMLVASGFPTAKAQQKPQRNVGSIRPPVALVSPKLGADGLARLALIAQVKR
jgi:hypothetical protein